MMQKYGNADSLIAKAGCYTCGRGDGLVSTGVSIEGEGILALCPGCIHDLAQKADYAVNATAEVAELREELERTKDDVLEVVAQRDELQRQLETIRQQWVTAVEEREALLEQAAEAILDEAERRS